MNGDKKRPPRQAVLALAWGDGHLEIYAERDVDVHLARVPVASTIEGEQTAEGVTELLLPRRYRDLWRADRLRAVGTTRPLLPSTLVASLYTRDVLAALNEVKQPAEEAVAWTL